MTVVSALCPLENDGDEINTTNPPHEAPESSDLPIGNNEDTIVNNVYMTQGDEHIHVRQVHGHRSKRAMILHVIHNKWFQITLMCLLLLDVIILFTEMYIAAEWPECDIMKRNSVSCCPTGGEEGSRYDNFSQHDRFLAGDEGDAHHHHEEVCSYPTMETEYPVGCITPHWVHSTHTALFSLTIVILAIFEVELLCLIVCLGKAFWCHCFYVSDFVVVTTAIVLELVLKLFHRYVLATFTGIMVLFRVWRFVRIGHGIAETTVELVSHRFEKLVHYNEKLEALLRVHNVDIPYSVEMHKLRSMDPWVTESGHAPSHPPVEEVL